MLNGRKYGLCGCDVIAPDMETLEESTVGQLPNVLN